MVFFSFPQEPGPLDGSNKESLYESNGPALHFNRKTDGRFHGSAIGFRGFRGTRFRGPCRKTRSVTIYGSRGQRAVGGG